MNRALPEHPLLNFLLASQSIAFLILDQDLLVQACNHRLREILHYDPTGEPFSGLLVDFTRPAQLSQLIGENKEPVTLTLSIKDSMPQSYTFRFLEWDTMICCFGERKGSDEDQFRLNLLETTNELGALSRELYKANANLAQTNDEKNHLLGMAAHDLKSPIGGIMSLSQVLLQDFCLDDEVRDMLRIIYDTATHMVTLLSDILDVAAIESGKLKLNLAPTSPEALARNVAQIHRLDAENKQITIDVANKGAPPVVSMDPLKMQQVLSNLLSNAIKFSHRGEAVHLTVEATPTHLRYTVSDHGQGISPEDAANLFQPFHQSRSRGTDGEKGTGLGLTIVKKIVDCHGGRIELSSPTGQGACFSVLLPLTLSERGT